MANTSDNTPDNEMTEVKVKFSIDPTVYFKGKSPSGDDDDEAEDGEEGSLAADQDPELAEDATVEYTQFTKGFDTSKMTDLQKHDAKYHPNGYKEGDKCKYRESMGQGDLTDKLDPENVDGEEIQGGATPGAEWISKNVANDLEKLVKEKVGEDCSVSLELTHVGKKGVVDYIATIVTPYKKTKETKKAVAEFFKKAGVIGDIEGFDTENVGKGANKHSEHMSDFQIDLLDPSAKAQWTQGAAVPKAQPQKKPDVPAPEQTETESKKPEPEEKFSDPKNKIGDYEWWEHPDKDYVLQKINEKFEAALNAVHKTAKVSYETMETMKSLTGLKDLANKEVKGSNEVDQNSFVSIAKVFAKQFEKFKKSITEDIENNSSNGTSEEPKADEKTSKKKTKKVPAPPKAPAPAEKPAEAKKPDEPKLKIGSPEFEQFINSPELEQQVKDAVAGSAWHHGVEEAEKAVKAAQEALGKAQEVYKTIAEKEKAKSLFEAIYAKTKDANVKKMLEKEQSAIGTIGKEQLQPLLDKAGHGGGASAGGKWNEKVAKLKAQIPNLKGFAKKKAEMMLKVWEKKANA